ncbi:L-fucose:H+ symporter permease [bacterium]|jgi:FHS family L-fucose permease-like MFS transporter|nr:L-fucose:H+ symporter permease [bacterium]
MKAIERKYLVPFCLVTTLFILWGIANNMTDTLLSAFKKIMSMSDAQTSLIQAAFYGSYFCFAIPAALFIRRFSYKSGVILGLAIYAAGSMLFFPASKTASYDFYLISIYILAGGCAILETTANPYILSMGAVETSNRRLNIAQAFNPLGSLTGVLLSRFFILSQLDSADATARAAMSEAELAAIQAHELSAVTWTYMAVGFVLIAVLIAMLLVKMPEGADTNKDSFLSAYGRLIKNWKFVFGVLALFFYMGAQIGTWSFTIRMVIREFDISEALAGNYQIATIVIFIIARFVFTWLMKYVTPSKLLVWAAIIGIAMALIVMLCHGMCGGWLCVGAILSISIALSLMFPTIYGLALEDVGADAKIGSSGLIMAILGAAVITPVQGKISDLTNINTAFVVVAVCFAVVMLYGLTVILTKSDKATGANAAN